SLNCCLAVPHRPLQIAAFDAVLHSDIAGIVFAIDKRRAVTLADRSQLAQGNLLSVRSAHQQVPYVVSAAAKLRLHAHDEIEKLFPLDDLGDRLPSDRGRNHALYIGNVDPVACDLVAVHIEHEAGLAEFADHRQIGKTTNPG